MLLIPIISAFLITTIRKESRKLETKITGPDFIMQPPRILLWLAAMMFITFGGMSIFAYYFDTTHPFTLMMILAAILFTIVPPLITIYLYYNGKIRVVGEYIYYTNILTKEKNIYIKNIDHVKLRKGNYQVLKMEIYVDSKKVLSVDDSYAGYSLLMKRLKDENITFSNVPIKKERT